MPNKTSPHGGTFFPQIISDGTLRPQDLLRSFAAELARLKPFGERDIRRDAGECATKIDEGDEEAMLCAPEIIEELSAILQTIAAREGNYWFGASESDGSCFDFWLMETDPDETELSQ